MDKKDQLNFFQDSEDKEIFIDPIIKKEQLILNSPISNNKRSKLNKVLILDTETTGLDPESHRCIEVGAILFDVRTQSVLSHHSFLLPTENNEAELINKIPKEITQLKQPWKEALTYFQAMVLSSDYVVAHNADFDKKWFGKGFLPHINKRWICSMSDIDWGENLNLSSTPSIRELALSHDVPVWSVHRALADCIYLAEVFKRCSDLENLLLLALEPKKLVVARVSYEDRFLAKQAGFKWNQAIKGAWSRRLSEKQISKLAIPISIVEDDI